jgi:putative membrane protein
VEHAHPGGPGPAVLPLLAALGAYAGAVAGERRRGRPWPAPRTASWVAGVVLVGAAVAVPLPGFRGHMVTHLVVGMVAPVLLVLAAPVTLALRALEVRRARRLSRLLRSRWAQVVGHPAAAAVLGVGSLVVLYRTPLLHRMLTDPAVHALVLLHVLAAGCLLTAALVGPDPAPHRPGPASRLLVLLLATGVHGWLAKDLYAWPPAGVPAAEVREAALLMSYGGDAVHVALAVALCAQWYRDAGRRRLRAAVRPA